MGKFIGFFPGSLVLWVFVGFSFYGRSPESGHTQSFESRTVDMSIAGRAFFKRGIDILRFLLCAELIRDELIRNCRFVMDRYTNCSDIDAQLNRLEDELAVVTGLIQKWVAENAKTAQDTDAFTAKCREYDARYQELHAKVEALEEEKLIRQGRVKRFEIFLRALKQQHGELTEFDESTWLAVIDTVLVKSDGKLVFKFANGIEVEQ